MQRTAGGSSSSSGGGGSEVSRGGLARFRSAPATWLEALLEEDEEELLKPNHSHCLTQLLSTSTTTTTTTTPTTPTSNYEPGGLNRLNSSPADFLGNSDGYFSNYGIPTNYEYLSQNMDVSVSVSSKRATQFPSPTHLKGEPSGQLPSGLVDMEMDKLLEDSVPCRVRAKRGCATHPRSIAERVRRTRISDRIRKLQELVPNMDKQTNTADMLDEAVEYVKFLQRQIQELSEHQRKCTCTAKE